MLSVNGNIYFYWYYSVAYCCNAKLVYLSESLFYFQPFLNRSEPFTLLRYVMLFNCSLGILCKIISWTEKFLLTKNHKKVKENKICMEFTYIQDVLWGQFGPESPYLNNSLIFFWMILLMNKRTIRFMTYPFYSLELQLLIRLLSFLLL